MNNINNIEGEDKGKTKLRELHPEWSEEQLKIAEEQTEVVTRRLINLIYEDVIKGPEKYNEMLRFYRDCKKS